MTEHDKFLTAIEIVDLEAVQKYIDEHKNNVRELNKGREFSDYNKQQRNENRIIGDTALICAARFGHLNIVKTLLAIDGIDVNAKNYNNESALNYAAGAYLLRHDHEYQLVEDENTKNQKKELKKTYTDIVRALLAAKKINIGNDEISDCDGTYGYGRYGNVALCSAAVVGQIDTVRLLIDAGADTRLNPRARDKLRSYSLWIHSEEQTACYKTILELIEYTEATRSAARQIQYIQDHFTKHDPSKLKDVIFNIANLFAVEKQYTKLAHQLYEVAANLDHEVAQHIVDTFKLTDTEKNRSARTSSRASSTHSGARDPGTLSLFAKTPQHHTKPDHDIHPVPKRKRSNSCAV